MIPNTSHLPRPRTLIHPGRLNPVRIQSMETARTRHVRLSLEPGRSLFDAIVEPLVALKITSASMTILGGYASRLQYCVAPPDPTGQAVIAYSAPIDCGPSYFIFGNATLGTSFNNTPLVHCHATIRTDQGTVRGGHIIPQTTFVGPAPISVLVVSLDDLELRQSYDPETNISLLQPFRKAML